MAKVPITKRSGSGLVESTGQAKLDPEAAATGGKMFFKLGQGLEEVAGQLERAHTLTETTKAENALSAKTADILSRAANDPDITDEKRLKYHEEIDAAKTDAATAVTLPYARNIFDSRAGAEAGLKKFEVDNFFRKRVIDQGKAALVQYEAEQSKAYYDTASPAMQEKIVGDLLANFENQATAGFITREEAAKKTISLRHDLAVGKVSNDLFKAEQTNDPQIAKQVKEALVSGAYEKGGLSIKPEKKKSLLDAAERVIRVNERKADRLSYIQRQNTTHELIDMANNGILTGAILEEKFKTKQISNTTYQALTEKTTSDVGPTAKTDAKTYYDITSSLLQEGMDPEEAAAKILKANAEGKLSAADAKKIYNMHLTPSAGGFKSLADMSGTEFDKANAAFEAQVKAIEDKRNWIKAAYKSIESAFYGPEKEQKVTAAMQTLTDTVITNKTPAKDIPVEADKIVAAENLKRHPEWARLPEKGKTGVDRFGNKVIVYPDGRVVESK